MRLASLTALKATLVCGAALALPAFSDTLDIQVGSGWNLLGNTTTTPLVVDRVFKDSARVSSVWHWNAGQATWEFYAPSLSSADLAAYASGHGFRVLSSIPAGQSYWVNALASHALQFADVAPRQITAANLANGWNQIAPGQTATLADLNSSLAVGCGQCDGAFRSVWQWRNDLGAWAFYAPQLAASGVLAEYNVNKGYQNITAPTGNGQGYWANSQIGGQGASERDTAFGRVVGYLDTENGAYAWLGIPYAAPPSGDKRWTKPTDPAAWATPKEAKNFGSACMQIGGLIGPQPDGQPFGLGVKDNWGHVVGQEDCLTLNIWSPASGETNLPVLVFIHGGSNIRGWSGTPDYWGAQFAGKEKVVFVSVNYRLGPFGYLNDAALRTNDAENDSGNFAILDLIHALKFVRNNIANFGGNPNNVTISGQSAGAINVWSLVASPKAAGLFHKAVPLSGFQTATTAATVENFVNNSLLPRLVVVAGLAPDTTTAATYITTNLNGDELKRAFLYGQSAINVMSAFSQAGGSSAPIYDGTVLPPDAASAFVPPYSTNVPVLSGVTNDEGKYWVPAYALAPGLYGPNYWEKLWTFNPDAPQATPGTTVDAMVNPVYLPVDKAFTNCTNTGLTAYTKNCLGTYTNFWATQQQTLANFKTRTGQTQIFAYNFAWQQQPEPWKTLIGGAHVSDIAFLFGNFGPGVFSVGYSQQNRPGREALSNLMQKSLSAFMRTGDPNHASLGTTWTTWPATEGQAQRLLWNADLVTPSATMSSRTTPL